MPVVLKTRGYDEEFYAAVTQNLSPAQTGDARKALGSSSKDRRIK
jgi:hypothetical protein